VSAQTATPGLLGLGDLTQGGRDAEAQTGHLDGAGRVLAAPDGDVEGALGGQAVADQLAPDAHDQGGLGAVARAGQQLLQEQGLAAGAQAELAAVAGRGLGGGHVVGQAGTLDDQAQQVGVDGVDPLADLVKRRRRPLGRRSVCRPCGHSLPQTRGPRPKSLRGLAQ
jgi:hypothetical protein